MKGECSYKIFVDVFEMLQCMDYCGGCGCEFNIGDGVGIFMVLFYGFFFEFVLELFGCDLFVEGVYVVGVVFFFMDDEECCVCKEMVEVFIEV